MGCKKKLGQILVEHFFNIMNTKIACLRAVRKAYSTVVTAHLYRLRIVKFVR